MFMTLFLDRYISLYSVICVVCFLNTAARQIHQLFQGADKNGDAILTLKEAVTLFKQMNLTSDLEHARRLFQVS